MKYDFDTVINRRNTNSLKWDETPSECPMWVADMDFQTAPEIRETLENRVKHGVFGYSIIPDEWNQAYVKWWKENHHFTIEENWLVFCTGVIPAISTAVRKLTTPGENVLVQTPVYNMFFNSIRNNGRNILESPLQYDGERYTIPWDDLEEKLANPQTSLMLLCNPHNPVGKIWDKDTLARIGELCEKYHVIVLSDEIHCDLTAPGKEYIPFASVTETCKRISITCIAPTKTFNIAGLQTAAVMIPDELLRHRMWRALNTDEVAEGNVFATDAAIAAFTKGKPWLDELRQYIQANKKMVFEFLKKELPQLRIVSMDVTYLLWIDCSNIPGTSDELAEFLMKETGLYLCAGTEYGQCGEHFLRMNVACPKSQIENGLNRLKRGINEYIK